MEKKLFLLLFMSFIVIILTACQSVHGSEKKEAQEKEQLDEKKIEGDTKVIEEKRKQEEQQRIEEEKRKQEEQQQQSTQVRGGKPTRSQISIGTHVEIILDKDRRTRVSGTVKDILTYTETHPYGIKVRLQDGQIGRVQSIG
ncbi:YwbE family protein [Bacillus cytotoxicus]|uniref:YwbE family protein n=1 Tax=Bacillus cereus group sp. BfR-BA-01492 TaxID=2920361 RepID=UPI001F55E505|nr:YwbE family protein [Bacillus cereus group sp. BfR-BA-01492]EMA6344654.1 YwbE family protein [Bacillus cytotoxicus]